MIPKRQDPLTKLYDKVKPTTTVDKAKAAPKGKTPPPASPPAMSDADVIGIMEASVDGAKIRRLLDGDTSDYNGNHSDADLGLCNYLAFYTNKNASQMDHIFRGSGLMRDKWDEPHYASGETYGQHTIAKAIADVDGGYTPGGESCPQGVGCDDVTTLLDELKDNDNPAKPKKEVVIPKTITAAELAQKTFAEVVEAIMGLLCEGLVILAAKPKKGKSWLALLLAIAVATGGMALGMFQAIKGIVLYLAMEDSQRRLQGRLEVLLGIEPQPDGLHIATEWPRLDRDGLAALDQWLTAHPGCRLVVIDTLARVKPPVGRGGDSYLHDATITADLQQLGLKHHCCILVIHHQRKMAAEDVFDSVSGTLGITASADVIMVLDRRGDTGTLSVTGRDIEEMRLAMEFDRGVWRCTGDADEEGDADPLEEAKVFLRKTLKDSPMDSDEVLKRGKAAGISRSRLFEAKKAMGFKAEKVSMTGGWRWPQILPPNSSSLAKPFEESGTLRDSSAKGDSPAPSVRSVPKSPETQHGEKPSKNEENTKASRSVPKSPTLFEYADGDHDGQGA